MMLLILPLVVVLNTTPDPLPLVPSTAEMVHEVRTYFGGETRAAVAVAGVGLVATTASATFLLHRQPDGSSHPILRGMALPLGALGLAQLGLAAALYLRTGPQVERLIPQLHRDPAGFVADERTRMTRVNGNWPVYRLVEIGLVGAGAGIAGTGFINGNDLLVGIGVGLALQVAVMMIVDAFAERRAHRYAERLEVFGRSR